MRSNRIIFRVEGNDQVGHGHFMRCLTMARYLKDELTCEFAMSNPSSLAIKELESHQLTWHRTPSKKQYHPDDPKSAEPWPFDLHGLLQAGDLLIMDGYRFDDTFIHASRQTGAKVIQVLDFFEKPIHADAVITQIPVAGTQISNSAPVWSGKDGFLIRPEFYHHNQTTRDTVFDVFIYVSSESSLEFYRRDSFLNGKTICALTTTDFRDKCENRGWLTLVTPKITSLVASMRQSKSAVLPASTIAIEYYTATSSPPRVIALSKNQHWGISKFVEARIWSIHDSNELHQKDLELGKNFIENPGESFLNWIHDRLQFCVAETARC